GGEGGVGWRELDPEKGEQLQIELLVGRQGGPDGADRLCGRLLVGGRAVQRRTRRSLTAAEVGVAQRHRVELAVPPLPFEEEAPEHVVGEEGPELDAVATLERPHAGEDTVA